MVSAGSGRWIIGLGEIISGGLGGGRAPLGPDPTSQLSPPRHSLIQAFMLVKASAGISFAFTWLSLFLQFEKQYFWRNQRGQHLHLSLNLGCLLLACLLAKLITQVSVGSMHSSG